MATKLQEKAALEIVQLLRELVAMANTDALEYKDFKKRNDQLAKKFEIAEGTRFKGFCLSETFQLMWIDPDAYLAEGSFMQRWLASQKQIHPSAITEATVAKYIYLFLRSKFGDFKQVSLVSPMGLPQLEEIATAAVAPPNQCMLLELSLAPGIIWNERGYMDNLRRPRQVSDPIPLITGERDALVCPTSGLQRDAIERLRSTAGRICSSDGDLGELVLTELQTNGVGNRLSGDDFENEHVQRYVYRDSTGEIHEHNFTGSTGPTLSEMSSEIRGFEQALTEGEDTPDPEEAVAESA
jgi:hypothetical protein